MISNIVRNYNRKEVNEEVNVGPYLEFKSSTPMTITPNYTNTGITLQYSLDTVTWNNIGAKGVTPSANTIYFRGRATGTKTLFTDSNVNNAWIFTGASNLEVHGDITMLVQDTLGGRVRDIPLGLYAFSNMFVNCTNLTVAPGLPATTLATYCYYGMFQGCTSLTTAPTLPATTLATYCYRGMFYGCTKIKLSTTKTGSYQTEYRIPKVGTGVDATDALIYMFTYTGGTFKGSPTINTTYYTENQVI
jgi:hypothetical protein